LIGVALAATPIKGVRAVTAAELAGWFAATGQQPHDELPVSIRTLAGLFVSEGRAEGIRGDVAFAQSIVETGYFSFPSFGQVHPRHNNYGGLGAVDGGNNPVQFPRPRIGVRAQIQHLRAYAERGVTAPDLAYPLVDTRFDLVTKGSAPNWNDLGGGKWATDPEYARKILDVFSRIVRWADARRAAVPLTGDWDGDGRDTPGWFKDGLVFLRNRNSGGSSHHVFFFGRAGDVPVVGDWDGDGKDTIGVRRGRTWRLRNRNSGGRAHVVFDFGTARGVPVAGDWDGDGADTIGVRREKEWRLRNRNSSGRAHVTFSFGGAAATPVSGDWDGDGDDTIGVWQGGGWRLRNANRTGRPHLLFDFGRAGSRPVTGDWDADGGDTVAVVNDVRWSLRNSNTSGARDRTFSYRR
jgi:hypothetical protein